MHLLPTDSPQAVFGLHCVQEVLKPIELSNKSGCSQNWYMEKNKYPFFDRKFYASMVQCLKETNLIVCSNEL